MFVAVLCGDGGRGRHAFINRRYYRSRGAVERSLFSVGQTLNPLVGKAPSKLNSAHDTIIVYLLVLQRVLAIQGKYVLWGKPGICNKHCSHPHDEVQGPSRPSLNLCPGNESQSQSPLPQHPLKNISSILRV